METKTCTTCGVEQPIENYHWHYKDKGIRRNACKTCRCNKEKELNATPERQKQRKGYLLEKTYGLSYEEYHQRLEQQGGGCALCGAVMKDRHLAVDHCHSSGKVRDILCTACNSGLGHFKDSPELLRRAADYLERHKNDGDPMADARLATGSMETPGPIQGDRSWAAYREVQPSH